jgi:2-dehydro-3-deoxyphosphooctonate aldolase (KDO 8-P synthase)
MIVLKPYSIKMGDDAPLFLIAGPCVIESRKHILMMAEKLKELTTHLDIPFIFKSSYDKANRTSINSYRGPGLKRGLEILQEVKEKFNIPVTSDVHSVEEINAASGVLDIIQIPAFLSRQTDLVVEAAKTGKVINIKKGQFLAPWDMKNIALKASAVGNKNIILTERGTTFGYNNLVSDMRSIPIMKSLGYPVVFDASHSVQLPGGKGSVSSGAREMIPVLALSAVAATCDGLFIEVHNNPDHAPCDAMNMLSLKSLPALIKKAKAIRNIIW